MSSILAFIEDGEQFNVVRLAICPKCGRVVRVNSDCECDILFQWTKKKMKSI
jgi:hypothetical protein